MRRRVAQIWFVGHVDTPTMQQNRSYEANVITMWLAAFFGLASLCGLVPAVGQAVSSFIGMVVVLVVMVLVLSWIVRRIRYYREDREDERLAALWRAEHAEPVQAGRPVRAA